jgi:dTDP-4-dehydrorhamnose 3,5-epimerase
MATLTPSDVIDGIVVVAPDIHGDERGIFIETYRRHWFPGGREMIQGNRGDRRQGALVGLHYHLHQADYWYVPFGRARVVLHDLRTGSPTDGATLTVDLGSEPGTAGVDHDHRGIYIPPGVAHGFAALTDMTITYLVDGYYNPADELGVAWDDPAIGADWGVVDPVVSARDQANPRRNELEPALQPHHRLRTA